MNLSDSRRDGLAGEELISVSSTSERSSDLDEEKNASAFFDF